MKCPESLKELDELEKLLPLCKVTLYEQAKARKEKHPEKSEREIERELSEELKKPLGTIRTSIRRGKMDSVNPFNLTESDKKAIIKTARDIKTERRKQRQVEREEQKVEISQIVTDAISKSLKDFKVEIVKEIPKPLVVKNEAGEDEPFDVIASIAGLVKEVKALKDNPIIKSENTKEKIESLEKELAELKKSNIESAQQPTDGDNKEEDISKSDKENVEKTMLFV